MTENLHDMLLVATSSLLLYFALHLILGQIPAKLKNSVYKTSRQFMGSAFLLVSFSIIVFFISDLKELPAYHRNAYNLSTYYIVAMLISMSYTTLIGKKPKLSRPKYLYSIISWFVYPIPLIVSIISENQIAIKVTQICAAIGLLVSIVVQILFFFKKYNKAIDQGKLHYAKGISTHIDWMIKSVYCIIIIGLLSTIFAFSSIIPRWIASIYLTSFMGVCIYIFNKFIGFTHSFTEIVEDKEIDQLIPEIDVQKVHLSPEVYQFITKQVNTWVASKQYCTCETSIQIISAKLKTNRLYLSNYINTTYKCSYRIWVSQLKIEEAKRILISDSKKAIKTVAEEVGFSSITSFTHAFKHFEGTSPRKWQLDQRKKQS